MQLFAEASKANPAAKGSKPGVSQAFQKCKTVRSSTPKFPFRVAIGTSRKHGQAFAGLLEMCKDMSLSLSVCKGVLSVGLVVALPGLCSAQASYSPNGAQYPIVSALPGDQVHPELAVNSTGGFVV